MKRLCVFLAALSYCVGAFPDALTDKIARANPAQVNHIAKRMVASIAKDAPTRINQYTTLVSVVFVSSTRTVIYSYETRAHVTEGNARGKLTAGVCSNEILYALARKGIVFRYDYSAPSGLRMLSVSVKETDC